MTCEDSDFKVAFVLDNYKRRLGLHDVGTPFLSDNLHPRRGKIVIHTMLRCLGAKGVLGLATAGRNPRPARGAPAG